ncbi:PEP-CTERM sorting domain-containing protein [Aquabacterium lacunae]|uniref:PEP-CTERM sorting domain-containing protein n=1 Tax=Aquabacterium lacunae TaxID=2528630 RepID=A0A4Q9GXK2_9BURK|nr:PEP-CTERM sorting domain-containing protein [Aquabacterium lacunae]TBO28352.1 PEP-CTERM sorting domain-containing protein [Aquabacterium lacunae]
MPHPATWRTAKAAACTLALAAAHLSAHAVVEAGHWRFTQDPAGQFGNFSVLVDQTVGGDYTGTFFDYDPSAGTLTYKTFNVDEGSEVWVTQPGAVIDNRFKPSLQNGQTTAVVGTDFYLGAATSSATDPGFSWATLSNRTSFGWAHFRADSSGKLTLVDSAMAFREPGIVVGTLSAVPEPSTWALMALGLASLAVRRQAHRQPRQPAGAVANAA